MGKKTKTSFAKGKKGGPGRPKGSPNIKTVMRAEQSMAERGFNPIDFLIDLAQAPKTAPDIKAKIGIELSSLINPKAKEPEEKEPPIDPEGDENDPNLPSDEKSLLSIVPNG